MVKDVKEVVEVKVVCPEEEDSKIEDLLKQLEAEGWTEIEEVEQEKKEKSLSPIEEAYRLLREYDVSLTGKIGVKPGSVSYQEVQQKTKEFSRLQAALNRNIYLEETPIMKGAGLLFSGLERIAKRPVVTLSSTEELFARYFGVADELMQMLTQVHGRYQELLSGVRSYKDGSVLKIFVESMGKKGDIEAEMQQRNKTFAKTGEQLLNITKSHPSFAKLYIAYNNLWREVRGLTNEFNKTCQRIVIKHADMHIMSNYENSLSNAVEVFDREKAYLADIIEHAKATVSVYNSNKDLNTGVKAIHSAVSSLSSMTYTLVGRILHGSQEIVKIETEMEKERILPKIQHRLSVNYGINFAGPRGYTLSFVKAAEEIAASTGIA